MQIIVRPFILLILFLGASVLAAQTTDGSLSGLQPCVSRDNQGTIRIVFGRADSIFCLTSTDHGATFSKPVLVGHIQGMHLGMTRGPQVAGSAKYSVITAIDKKGTIHCFRLNHAGNGWEKAGMVNDLPYSAPEGLMGLAADKEDHFYAVWLDLRLGRKNNICFAALDGDAGKWSKNQMIYISPDQHVCECCKPSVDVQGSRVAVMFRNWLNGSRDLYLMISGNGGKTFGKAEKLGTGTWKLDACPMDGGGLAIGPDGKIQTVWRREALIYSCNPPAPEVYLTRGRDCSLAVNKNGSSKTIITLQDGGEVKLMALPLKNEILVGKGSSLTAVLLSETQALCTWEQDKKIRWRKIEGL